MMPATGSRRIRGEVDLLRVDDRKRTRVQYSGVEANKEEDSGRNTQHFRVRFTQDRTQNCGRWVESFPVRIFHRDRRTRQYPSRADCSYSLRRCPLIRVGDALAYASVRVRMHVRGYARESVQVCVVGRVCCFFSRLKGG